MTWTYAGTLTTDLDKVRLLIGDTDTTQQQLTDEELNFFISEEETLHTAAAAACRALASKYARKVHREVGDLKLYAEQMYQHYLDLAKELSVRGSSYAVPSAGGVYTADKEAYESDTSLVQPEIKRGIHDYE